MTRTTLQNPTLSDRDKSAAPLSEYQSSSRPVGLLNDDIEYRRLYARYLAWTHRDMTTELRRAIPLNVVVEIETEREKYGKKISKKKLQRKATAKDEN